MHKLSNYFIKKYSFDIEEISGIASDIESAFNSSNSKEDDEEKPPSSKYQCPLKGTSWKIIGGFHDNRGTSEKPRYHNAIDMAASEGSPIYPIASGKVIRAGNDPLGGIFCTIQHGNLFAYYAHMKSRNVNAGDKVNNDTILGYVGNTGNAKGTPPHLHLLVATSDDMRSESSSAINPTTLWR